MAGGKVERVVMRATSGWKAEAKEVLVAGRKITS